MKKILLPIIMLPIMLFTACSSDEHITDTEIWYIAREDKSGDNKITGTFCFFKDGDYDPTTFEYKINSSPSNVWEDASIKTKSGETVRSFFIDIVLKSERGYGVYKCEPGTYYIVALVKNKSSNDIWKATKVNVEKNKVVVIDAVFKDMYISGYVGWEE